MAIETKETKRKGVLHRAYWRNPFTRKQEVGPWVDARKEAKKLDDLMRWKLEHERESFRPVDYVDQPEGLTVSAILLLYYTKAPMEESTRREAFYHSRQVVNLIGSTLVQSLSRGDVKAMEATMRQTVKQNTIQRRVSVLRSALAWAVEEKYIAANPIEGYRTKRGVDLQIEPPSPTEVHAILANSAEHLVRAIVVGFNSGVRIGASELFKLQWSGFRMEWKQGLVNGAPASILDARMKVEAAHKNDDRQWRWVPLRPEVAWLMEAWRRNDETQGIPWIISYRGEQIKHKLATAWKRAKERAGVTRRIRPYDLRHAFVTYAIEGGASLKSVAKLAGHADETMILRRYQHIIESQEKAAVECLPRLNVNPPEPDEAGRQNQYTNEGISGGFSSTDDNPPQ